MSQRELERQINRTTKAYYDWNLGSFRAELEYNEGLEPFVRSLVSIFNGDSADIEPGAPYARASASDSRISVCLKDIRAGKRMQILDIASEMGVHPDFLSALEQGQLIAFPHHIGALIKAVHATEEERDIVVEHVLTYRARRIRARGKKSINGRQPLDRAIRGVIESYYEQNLWVFRPQFNYEDSISPFVQSLVSIALEYRKTSRKYRSRMRAMPPIGYKLAGHNGEQAVVIDEKVAPQIRATFKAYAK